MKLISKITDKEILGLVGESSTLPRCTSRAILRNENNKYAVIYSQIFNLYSLPGGAVEDNEDFISALKREVLEETGCSCERIKELGYIEENRAHSDFTQISYYYVVETHLSCTKPCYTEDETANGTEVQWYSLNKLMDLIETPKHSTAQRKFIQARDVAALKEYSKQLEN